MELRENTGAAWTPFDPAANLTKSLQDVKLQDGTVVKKCYPNAGQFVVMQKDGQEQYYDNDIRFNQVTHFRLLKVINRI